ncbi:hypothetical protein [Oleiharenicola sp. Vm1]|uniref:hypothetical protein n=1 Tax=Oleiharenicola sp. Vm1 TaxID=3398393 RepID=UPI0039F5209D
MCLPRRLAFILAAAALAAAGFAQEVQQHGLAFERWVRDTFFGGYQPASYTQRWDIPAEVNRDHGGVPVNPKAAKFGGPVDLGDALRQYEIGEPFVLVLGFWEQVGDEKRFVTILAPLITPEQWRALWGDVTYADLLRLDELIKDPGRPIEEVRRLALRMKSAPPFTTAVIQLNPKIDARQRRLQCSLRFADVFKHLAPGAPPRPAGPATLWGVPFPGPLHSPPRGS